MSTVVLRADASVLIGAGHVVRSLALAEALAAEGARCVLASHELSPAFAARCQHPAAITADPGTTGDLEQTLAIARGENARHVVVDHYRVGSAYLEGLTHAGLLVTVIDDVGDRHLPVDLVVNPNHGVATGRYSVSSHTVLLAGLRYALLRREFRVGHLRAEEPRGTVEAIAIVMGGSDPHNQTAKVLDGLAQIAYAGRVLVVLGAENPHAVAARTPSLDVKVHVDVKDMPALLAEVDLVVSSASTSCVEAMCLGKPVLTVVNADNQKPGAAALAGDGLVCNLGWHADVTTAAMADALRALIGDAATRSALSRRGLAVVDGLGTARVAEAMLGPLAKEIV